MSLSTDPGFCLETGIAGTEPIEVVPTRSAVRRRKYRADPVHRLTDTFLDHGVR
jgi:hypothetical protein